MNAGLRKIIEPAGMVEVEVGEDDVAHVFGVEPQPVVPLEQQAMAAQTPRSPTVLPSIRLPLGAILTFAVLPVVKAQMTVCESL